MDIQIINFDTLGDDRGNLVSLESNNNIPFTIERVYYLFHTDVGTRRGFHAHKELKQVAVVLKGSCKFLLDDGFDKETVLLDKPTEGLLIESFMWREMFDFSEDCVLMVIASQVYNEDDYVRDYSEFVSMVNHDS
jgi:dTDP-4-dehydrorhamnose 3,5-epimerase-like enzyme